VHTADGGIPTVGPSAGTLAAFSDEPPVRIGASRNVCAAFADSAAASVSWARWPPRDVYHIRRIVSRNSPLTRKALFQILNLPVGTGTETYDYLRMLFCPPWGHLNCIMAQRAQSNAKHLSNLPDLVKGASRGTNLADFGPVSIPPGNARLNTRSTCRYCERPGSCSLSDGRME